MNLEKLFNPTSLAVVGVSLSNDRHPANVVYNKNHLRYPLSVYPVNPRGGTLRHEKVYASITEIPVQVDLVVIVVKAEQVPEVMESCIRAQVGGAIVVSGGFEEVGRKDLQERLVSMAREADFPFIGPNCLGVFAPDTTDTLFLPSERMIRPRKGNVALVSQSGGILVDQIVKFAEENVGLSVAVSIGNKALIGEKEMLTYLAEDAQTEVIAFYIEGFGKNEGREFVQATQQIPKPVIVLKAGKSPGGSRAVSSHTAALAGDYEVFSAVCSQFGIVEARDEYELISFCESLSRYRSTIQGRIGVVTGSGGHGAMAVDICMSHALSVPSLGNRAQQEIIDQLSPSIQTIASVTNPIDLTGSAVDDDFVTATKFLSQNPEIDCVVVLLLPYLPSITSDLGARLSQIYLREEKPLIAYVPHVERYRMIIEGFELNNIPVAHSIEGAVLMAEAMRRSRSQ